MKTFLFHLVSGQAMPNYIAAKEINPDVNVLLYTKNTVTIKNNLAGLLGKDTRSLEIDPFNHDAIVPAIKKFIENFLPPEAVISLNFTGGTKIASIALFQYFNSGGNLCVYVDTQNNTMYRFSEKGNSSAPLNINIPVSVFFGMEGQEIKNEAFSESEQMRLLREYLEKEFNKVSKSVLADAFMRSMKKTGVGKISHFTGEISQAFKDKAGNYQFSEPGKELIEYLDGKWFETTCFNKLQSLGFFGTLERNIVILFRDKQLKNAPPIAKNEIDIFGSRGINPYLFEIKSGKVESADIDQLNAIKAFAGKFSTAVIISHKPITKPRLLNRASEKGILLTTFAELDLLPGKLMAASAHI